MVSAMTAASLLEEAFAHHKAGRLETAQALYRNVLARDNNDLNALQLLGAIASDTQRHEQAATLFCRAIEVLEARGDANGQHAALYYNAGNALAAAGRPVQAASTYRRGLSLSPDMPDLHARLATVLVQQGDLSGAAAAYQTALRQRPDQTEWLNNLGCITVALGCAHVSAGEWKSAAACLEQALTQRPDDAETLWIAGRLAETRREFDAAEASYRRALTLNAEHASTLFDFGTLLYRERQRPAEALALFDRLAAIAPGHNGVHCARGNALRIQRQPEAALTAYRRYLDVVPGSALAHLRVAEALSDIGQAGDALEPFNRCLAAGADDDMAYLAHIGLGNAYRSLGDETESLIHYSRALQLQPLASHRATTHKADFEVLLILAPGSYNTPYEYLISQAPFDTHILLLLPEYSYDLPMLASRADVVMNLVSDVDHHNDMLDGAAALINNLGKPVINHPDQIHTTDRVAIASLLSGIPHCRVAWVERHRGADMLDRGFFTSRETSVPMLARVAGRHGGDDFEHIETARDLQQLVTRNPASDHYLIEYLDYRSADGYFRKYRFFIVGDTILPYHLAIGSEWKVHHFRTDMANQAWMRREEEAFLRTPEAIFGPRHFRALRAIRDAMGLAFFGIDCAVDRNGDLVVFEANATMLVHDDHGDFAYKNPFIRKIRTAFAMLLRQTARPPR